MSTTSKSPRKVLLVAHAAALEVLPPYAHRFAPRKFTQHQLFACLVLKVHQKKDYRGICALLQECSDLRQAIGLEVAPHYTTLQKAAERLLGRQNVQELLEQTLAMMRTARVKHSAADSSGFATHHASRYFIWRTHNRKGQKSPRKRVSYRRYGKLMLLACCMSHMILGAVASAGPTPDIAELERLIKRLPGGVRIERLSADAGFDSAHNHRLLREQHGILSIIPPFHGRPLAEGKLPADRYRRLMKQRFNRKAYARRSQVETVFSMIKRNLGDSLRGRTHHSRRRDLLLMVLTHNIAILLFMQRKVFYGAWMSPFPRPTRQASTEQPVPRQSQVQ